MGPKVKFSGGLLDGWEVNLPAAAKETPMWDKIEFVTRNDGKELKTVYELTHFSLDNTSAKFTLVN